MFGEVCEGRLPFFFLSFFSDKEDSAPFLIDAAAVCGSVAAGVALCEWFENGFYDYLIPLDEA